MYEPKTRAGIRRIPIAGDLVEKLRAYRQTTIARDGSSGLVFPNDRGLPMLANGISQSLKAAGIKLKLHSLRHYFASHCLAEGASLAQVSKLLGHSSIEVTSRVYVHCLPESDWKPAQPGRQSA
jgi:integrase